MEHPLVVDPAHPLVERVRVLCLRYPEAVEVRSHGRPVFKAGKVFASIAADMARPFTVLVKPDADERRALLDDPRFFSPPYVGPSGWVATHLDAPDTDWQKIAELIDTSYRGIALKRQLAELDRRLASPESLPAAVLPVVSGWPPADGDPAAPLV